MSKYCQHKATIVEDDKIDSKFCEEECGFAEGCLQTDELPEVDTSFAFEEEEDFDDDSDINNHEDDE